MRAAKSLRVITVADVMLNVYREMLALELGEAVGRAISFQCGGQTGCQAQGV